MRFNGYQYIRLSGGGDQDIRTPGDEHQVIRISGYTKILTDALISWYPAS
jgi:hypothetical protein